MQIDSSLANERLNALEKEVFISFGFVVFLVVVELVFQVCFSVRMTAMKKRCVFGFAYWILELI